MKRGLAWIALRRLLSGQVAQADQLHSLIVHARTNSEVTLHSSTIFAEHLTGAA